MCPECHQTDVCVYISGVVTREMLNSMQNAEIISRLTKEFNEVKVGVSKDKSGSVWTNSKLAPSCV